MNEKNEKKWANLVIKSKITISNFLKESKNNKGIKRPCLENN